MEKGGSGVGFLKEKADPSLFFFFSITVQANSFCCFEIIAIGLYNIFHSVFFLCLQLFTIIVKLNL